MLHVERMRRPRTRFGRIEATMGSESRGAIMVDMAIKWINGRTSLGARTANVVQFTPDGTTGRDMVWRWLIHEPGKPDQAGEAETEAEAKQEVERLLAQS